MKFLPTEVDGRKVYAGFWLRVGAGTLDSLIVIPLAWIVMRLDGFDRWLAIVLTIPTSCLFAMYNVFFNARCGGTPGKLAIGIRVTKPDGSPIGWPEAWKRSAVDLALALSTIVVDIWCLLHVDPVRYAAAGWRERTYLVNAQAPAWQFAVLMLLQAWLWSDAVVLLFNERKRAIHDFIGGTVVIRKEFAGQESGPEPEE